jgi:hypothetical protein
MSTRNPGPKSVSRRIAELTIVIGAACELLAREDAVLGTCAEKCKERCDEAPSRIEA